MDVTWDTFLRPIDCYAARTPTRSSWHSKPSAQNFSWPTSLYQFFTQTKFAWPKYIMYVGVFLLITADFETPVILGAPCIDLSISSRPFSLGSVKCFGRPWAHRRVRRSRNRCERSRWRTRSLAPTRVENCRIRNALSTLSYSPMQTGTRSTCFPSKILKGPQT